MADPTASLASHTLFRIREALSFAEYAEKGVACETANHEADRTLAIVADCRRKQGDGTKAQVS